MTGFTLLAFGPFGSIAMLGWLAAAAAPILIHFWSRRRHRPMKWAAMKYLQAALKKNARRIRVEQLLLLLVRIAILVLFAAALADPFIPALSSFAGGLGSRARTHWVFVVDASYSMDFRQGDSTRLEQAKETLKELLGDVQQGDGFSLVLMGDPPQVVIGDPAYDAADVIDEISATPLLHVGGNLTATLAEVEQIVNQAKRRHQRLEGTRVCILSDLQASTWNAIATPQCAQRIDSLSQLAELILIDLGETNGPVDNLAVAEIQPSESIITVGRPVEFTVAVRNLGVETAEKRGVTLFVNDIQKDRKFVSVKPGDQATTIFNHQFEAAGDYRVRVQLDGDSLSIDNQAFFAAAVRPSIRALCVRGKQGAAYLVYRSLNPFTSPNPRIEAELASETALLETNLANYDCIFLCNVGRISPDEGKVLRRYVHGGGGLVIGLGDQTQPASYNEQLGKQTDGSHILPAKIGELVTAGEYFLSIPANSKHPMNQPLRGNASAGLFTLPTQRYFRLTPIDETPVAPAFEFSNGDPALLDGNAGKGYCILYSTALSPGSVDNTTSPPVRWSYIPDWLNFPALPQEMLAAAIRGNEKQRNVLVGDTLSAALPGAASSVDIISPSGDTQRAEVNVGDASAGWSFNGATRAGFYRATGSQRPQNEQLFAVNLNIAESDLRRYDRELLPETIQRELVANDGSQAIATQPAKLFRYFLIAVLVLLLVESFLARRMGAA